MCENDQAVSEFLAAKGDIEVLAALLADAAAGFFDLSPESVDWAVVGSIKALRDKLVGAVASTSWAAGVVAENFGISVAAGAEICEGAGDGDGACVSDLLSSVWGVYGDQA